MGRNHEAAEEVMVIPADRTHSEITILPRVPGGQLLTGALWETGSRVSSIDRRVGPVQGHLRTSVQRRVELVNSMTLKTPLHGGTRLLHRRTTEAGNSLSFKRPQIPGVKRNRTLRFGRSRRRTARTNRNPADVWCCRYMTTLLLGRDILQPHNLRLLVHRLAHSKMSADLLERQAQFWSNLLQR